MSRVDDKRDILHSDNLIPKWLSFAFIDSLTNVDTIWIQLETKEAIWCYLLLYQLNIVHNQSFRIS